MPEIQQKVNDHAWMNVVNRCDFVVFAIIKWNSDSSSDNHFLLVSWAAL